MLELRFCDSIGEKYAVEFAKNAENIVNIEGKNVPQNTSGFFLSREGKNDKWDYTQFKTIYRVVGNIIQFSNDGSVYEPPREDVTVSVAWSDDDNKDKKRPKQIKVKVSAKETTDSYDCVLNEANEWKYTFENLLKECSWVADFNTIPDCYEVSGTLNKTATYVRTETPIANKITELNANQQTAIHNGTDVTLSNEKVEHFTLTEHDQTSLLGLQSMIAMGMEQIPWHTSDHSEGCKYYSPQDMTLIIDRVLSFLVFHITYFRDLRRQVMDMTDREAIVNVQYGDAVVEPYISDVLRDLMNQMA